MGWSLIQAFLLCLIFFNTNLVNYSELLLLGAVEDAGMYLFNSIETKLIAQASTMFINEIISSESKSLED